MEKDTGYASAGLGSNHPDLQRRSKEILEILFSLSEIEKWEAMKAFSITKWHRINTANDSFQAPKEQLIEIEK